MLFRSTDFRIGYYRDDFGGLASVGGSAAAPIYSVMATVNNTNVNLNGVFIQNLNAGESYFFQASVIGSLLETSKPCVVMSGQWGDAPGGCTDGVFTEVFPISLADTSYVVVRGAGTVGTGTNLPERSTVIATVANTVVTLRNYSNTGAFLSTSTVTLVNPGSYTVFAHGDANNIYSSTTINADKKVVVFSGIAAGCENDFSMLPPLQLCSGSLNVQTFKFRRFDNSDLPFVGYVTVRSATGIVFLNGVNIETLAGSAEIGRAHV